MAANSVRLVLQWLLRLPGRSVVGHPLVGYWIHASGQGVTWHLHAGTTGAAEMSFRLRRRQRGEINAQ